MKFFEQIFDDKTNFLERHQICVPYDYLTFTFEGEPEPLLEK